MGLGVFVCTRFAESSTADIIIIVINNMNAGVVYDDSLIRST